MCQKKRWVQQRSFQTMALCLTFDLVRVFVIVWFRFSISENTLLQKLFLMMFLPCFVKPKRYGQGVWFPISTALVHLILECPGAQLCVVMMFPDSLCHILCTAYGKLIPVQKIIMIHNSQPWYRKISSSSTIMTTTTIIKLSNQLINRAPGKNEAEVSEEVSGVMENTRTSDKGIKIQIYWNIIWLYGFQILKCSFCLAIL